MTAFPNGDPDAESARGSSRRSETAKLADPALALDRVREFISAANNSSDAYSEQGFNTYEQQRQYQAQLRGLLPLIRDIAERIHPDCAPDLKTPPRVYDYEDPMWEWDQTAAAAETLAGVLEHQGAHEQIFGSSGPSLAASGLHEWVWEAAKGRWDAGYYGDAVHAAAEVINQKTKVKLGRPDLSGTRLYASAFSLDPPKPGQPRLRFASVNQQDEETWKSVHQGAMHLGMACSQGIRNPQAHKTATHLTEQQALEQLGALSVLARLRPEGSDLASS